MEWTGEGDGARWTDPLNWEHARVPGPDDAVVIGGNAAVSGAAGTVKRLEAGAGVGLQAAGLTIREHFSWSGATLQGGFTVEGTLHLGGGRLSGGTLELKGTTLWLGGRLLAGGQVSGSAPAIIRNLGDFFAGPEAIMFCEEVGAGAFHNAGTFRVEGPYCLVAGWRFANSGTIRVESGVLEFRPAGADGHLLMSGTRITGGGLLRIGGGERAPAEARLGGSVTIAIGAQLELAAGGKLSGNGTLSGPGRFAWTGGEIAGRLELADTALAEIRGEEPKRLTGTIYNHGTAAWTGGGPLLAKAGDGPGPLIVNDGSFTVWHYDATLDACGGAPAAFRNRGAFIKTGSDGVTRLRNWSFENSGMVAVDAGVLSLGISGAAGPHRLDGGALAGGGCIRIGEEQPAASGLSAAVIRGSVTTAAGTVLELGVGGLLSGGGTVAGPGTLLWSGGTVTGEINLPPGSTLEIRGDAAKELAGFIDSRGATRWSGNGDGTGVGLFVNQGVFRCDAEVREIQMAWDFDNTGLFAPPRRMRFANNFTQESSGTLQVEIAGRQPGREQTALAVEGAASLAGTLAVQFPGGFAPNRGERFQVITAVACTGQLEDLRPPAAGPLLSMQCTESGVWLRRRAAPGYAGRQGRDRYVVYETEVWLNGDQPWRDHNPCAVKAGAFAEAHGAIGREPDGLAIFPDRATGQQAGLRLFESEPYVSSTIEELPKLLAREAPGQQEDLRRYADRLVEHSGLDRNRRVGSLTGHELLRLAEAIETIEAAHPGEILSCEGAPDWVAELLGCPQR